jgi:glycerol-3-phosphate O-acyltransferase/dihydroxyacetone phosphate acyltransferase
VERPSTPTHRRHGSEVGGDSEIFSSPPSPLSARKPSDNLPRNESFQNIGSVGFFASRPSTPNRSRSRTNSASDGLKLTRMTSMTPAKEEPKSNMEEVSKNLSEALRERRGRRQSEPNGFEFGDEEGSSEEEEEPTKKDI